MKFKKYSQEEINYLIENYNKLGAKHCSEYLNRPVDSLRSLAYKKLKIKVSKECRSKYNKGKIFIKDINDYSVISTQFTNVDTPISAYILGLIWADGYIKHSNHIYSISLSTTYPDANYFIPLFLKTGKWKIYNFKHKNSNWKLSCTIKTHNFYLSKFLTENDYITKSNASADKILSLIPENLQHYWFRGLLDGDGYIMTGSKYSVGFASSIDQDWTYLEKLAKKLGIKYFISKRNYKSGQSSTFCISNRDDSLILLNYIYNNYISDNIGLSRKYNKYKNIVESKEKFDKKGVCLTRDKKFWRAYKHIKINGKYKQINLGFFDNKEMAIKAVQDYTLKLES